MPTFITRINLHNASENDYKTLFAELAKESFTDKSARKSARRKSTLHKGEFNRSGNISMQEVINSVVRAGERTGRRYSFTVLKEKSD